MTTYHLTAFGGTGLGYYTNIGDSFVADLDDAVSVVAKDDDAFLNDWTDVTVDGVYIPGVYDGDTNSTVVSSEIPWLESGDMITSGYWVKLSYTDPVTSTTAHVETFVIFNDSDNSWGDGTTSGTYVFATEALLDGVTYTAVAIDQNAGVAWNLLVCFAIGTRIDTAQGPITVENLSVGDLVHTLDHGPQPIRWIGKRTVEAQGAFAPICIRQGALGNQRDLFISPQHRMLLRDERAELYFGESEVLVAAKHLVNGKTILSVPGGMVTYYHFLFDTHEIVRSEGIPSESLHPNHHSLRGISERSRREVLMLFPELASRPNGISDLARTCLKRREAALLADVSSNPL